jgi:ketosteroid isomerase-like protein
MIDGGADVGTGDAAANKELVRRQLAAMEARDTATLAAVFSADARWWVPQSACAKAGIERPLVGRDAVVAMAGGSEVFFSRMAWTIDLLVAEGAYVAAHMHMEGTTASGNDYLNHYHFLYRIEDGLITDVWEHVDTAYAFERMGM